MTAIAVIGHLTRDVVAGGEPRPGGGVFYAARALARGLCGDGCDHAQQEDRADEQAEVPEDLEQPGVATDGRSGISGNEQDGGERRERSGHKLCRGTFRAKSKSRQVPDGGRSP